MRKKMKAEDNNNHETNNQCLVLRDEIECNLLVGNYFLDEGVCWPDYEQSEGRQCEKIGVQTADFVTDELFQGVDQVQCDVDYPQDQDMQVAVDCGRGVDFGDRDHAHVRKQS